MTNGRSNLSRLKARDISESLGKLPPQACDLEEAILGAIMLEKQAIQTALSCSLKPDHFYKDCHQEVFSAIVSLYNAKEDIDFRTVTYQLRKTGKIELVGGPTFPAELTTKVSSGDNIETHIRTIQEMAMKRELIQFASTIHNKSYEDTEDVFKIVDEAQAGLDSISGANLKDSINSVADILDEAVKRIIALRNALGITGVESGWLVLDKFTGGFQVGLTIIAARPGMGKALSLNEDILTDVGWVKMRNVKTGINVASSDGLFYPVTAVYPQGLRKVYDVHFDDKTIVRCDINHLWKVQSRNDRKNNRPSRVISLSEMLKEPIILNNNRKNYSIEYNKPICYKEQSHYIHPYILGVLIGDGCITSAARFSNPENELVNKVKQLLPLGYKITSNGIERNIVQIIKSGKNLVVSELDRLSLLGKRSYEKHIPAEYLNDSIENRLSLLHGLIDTDGNVTQNGTSFVKYNTASQELQRNVVDLVRSLGGKAVTNIRPGKYYKDNKIIECRLSYEVLICFDSNITPASSKKHLAKYKRKRFFKKYITKIVPLELPEETQCISVDSPDNTFLTNNYTVTHNTGIAVCATLNAAVRYKKPVALFSLEMSDNQIMNRMIASEAEIELERMIKGQCSDMEIEIIKKRTEALKTSGIYIDDTPALHYLKLRTKVRRLVAEHGVQLIIIDYLQLMKGDQDGNREREISSISAALKNLSKEVDRPIIAFSQLSRAVETRGGDKRPQLSDLRESGSIEQDANMVAFLYRPEYYGISEDENGFSTLGNLEVIIAKHRDGPTGTVKLKFLNKFVKVIDDSPQFNPDAQQSELTFKRWDSRKGYVEEIIDPEKPF